MDPVICGNAALGLIAAVSAATDLYCGKIYNGVTVTGLCLGILLSAQRAGAAGILEVMCAAGFTVLVLFPFYSAGGLGAGDVKLLAAVASFMPAEDFLRCFAVSFAIGAAAGIGRLILSRGERHSLHFALPVAAAVAMYLAGLF